MTGGRERVGGGRPAAPAGSGCEREQGGESAGSDAAEHDSQRSHYRSHAVRERWLVKNSQNARRKLVRCRRGTTRSRCAFRVRQSASGSSLAAGPVERRAVRRGPLRQPLGLSGRSGDRTSTARRSPSSSQHQRTGPVRWASVIAWARSAERRPRRGPGRFPVAQGEGGGDPVPHEVHPAELPVADGVLPGPPPALPHEAHRLAHAGQMAQAVAQRRKRAATGAGRSFSGALGSGSWAGSGSGWPTSRRSSGRRQDGSATGGSAMGTPARSR